MSQAVISVTSNVLGQTVTSTLRCDEDGACKWTPTLAAAKKATTWTKATDSTGTAVLATGHGLTTGNKVTVFWAGGRRYGMTAAVTGDSIALAGGAGDTLPASATAVTLGVQTIVKGSFDPDEIALLQLTATGRVSIELVTAAAAVSLAVDLAAGNTCLWWNSSGIVRPVTGDDIVAIHVANGDEVINNVTAAVLYDATA